MPMHTREVQLYHCKYKNTYSILIAADGQQQAEGTFEIWLAEKGVQDIELTYGDVKRTLKSETRPVYTLA